MTDLRGGPSRSVGSGVDVNIMRRRVLTAAGNFPAYAVPNGATSVTLTFPQAEQTPTYGVAVTPSWSTTVWVTNKTETGCTVHFGTAAPATGSPTIDVSSFQSE